MPTTSQRLSAVLLSAAILIGGSWIASLVPGAKANETQVADTRPGLEVIISNVRNSRGQVIIMVMDSRDAFKTYDIDAAASYQEIRASAGTLKVVFPGLTRGPYAVMAFHDENGNRDLDFEEDIPTEGYAVSGARDAYDEPPFDRAASIQATQTIQMHYLK